MQDLVDLGAYEHVTNHAPPPIEPLLLKLSSEHSRRTYREVALGYLAWIEYDPFQAGPILVNNYKAELLLYCTPAIVALRLRIVKELYDEVVASGWMRANPVVGVVPPQCTPDPSCLPPTPDVADAHIDRCRRHTEAGLRDYALCLLATQTAIPRERVPLLRVADFRYQGGDGYLRVAQVPGHAGPEVHLPGALAQSIEEYLKRREVADDSPLFGLPRFDTPGCHGARP
ncbi:MAG: hypothetical protein QME94_12000, partial [Anaerolineae bacterium]|nr:hypothetical protein [Anaerolineae bacterium]